MNPANRHIQTTERLPLEGDGDHGVLVPSCARRGPVYVIPYWTGVGLRIGGEANLCFTCGPNGGVYHPDGSMAETLVKASQMGQPTGGANDGRHG